MALQNAVVARFVSLSFHFSGFSRGKFLHAFLPVLAAAWLSLFVSADAAPLRYQPKAGSKIAYEVEITADSSNALHTYKGVIAYDIVDGDDPLEIEYKGNLTHNSKLKPRAKYESFFFDRGPLSPVYFPAGLMPSHEKNRITLYPCGKINSIEGYSQLPFLLGDLSILIFEPLSEEEQKAWTSKIDVSVLKGHQIGWCWRPLAHWHCDGYDKRISGEESTSFTFVGDDGDLSKYKKTYSLHSAADKESIDVKGEGNWTFNRRENMPESHDCQYKMVHKQGDITVELPVTVKYRRMSEEDYAKYDKEQKEKQKKLKEEHEKRFADQKKPLEGEDRRQALEDLKSGDVDTLRKVLDKLSNKSERDDKEIAEALKPLLLHSNLMVRDHAERALLKFAPQFGRQMKIKKDYAGMGPVDDIGTSINENTPLPPGLIVAANKHGNFYFSAQVVKKLDDGQVEVQLNNCHRNETLHWTKIRLAPPEVDQPFVDKSLLVKIYGKNHPSNVSGEDTRDDDADTDEAEDTAAASKADRDYRTWTDSSGTFAVVAKYVGSHGDKIVLKKKADDKEIRVPLDRLSKPDRAVAERLQKAPQVSNPFE